MSPQRLALCVPTPNHPLMPSYLHQFQTVSNCITLFLFYRLALMLNGLSSAALYESNAKRLIKYKAKNRMTRSLSPPLPISIRCALANGLLPTGRLGSVADPSVRPLD